MNNYDITIVGAGPGGYVAAVRAAQLGAKVALIEKNRVGGTCLHRGCIPSKSFISSVKTLKSVKNAAKFGIEVDGEARPNLETIRDKTNQIIGSLEKGILHLLKSNKVDLIQGTASFQGPRQIVIKSDDGEKKEIETEKAVLAVGSSPSALPLFQGIEVLNTDTVFSLETIPSSMIIIGGGVTGCEFASIYRGLGTKVAIVELESQLLPGEDPEIVKTLRREFKKRQISILTGVRVVKAGEQGGEKVITLEDDKEIRSETLLVTVGRKPNTSGLGLEKLGVEPDAGGNIPVNEKMETSVPGVYAIGDITGKWLLAHVASKEGIVAVENAMGVENAMDYSAIPATVFTDPEIGGVGLSANEAEAKGFKVKVGSFSFRALGKAQITQEIAGEVRLTVEEDTGRLLGARIIGPNASELIHEAALAVSKGLTVQDLGETVHSHPTLSEAVMEAAWDGYKQSIH